MTEPEASAPEIDEALRKLPPKRRKFVLAYIGECNGNAAKAYEHAGYAVKNPHVAHVEASNILANSGVRAAIDSFLEHDSLTATPLEIRRWQTRVLRGEERHTVLTKDGQIVEVPFSEKERMRAAEALQRVYGEYTQKHEHTGKDGKPIRTEQREGGLSRRMIEQLKRDLLGIRRLEDDEETPEADDDPGRDEALETAIRRDAGQP